MFQRRKLTTAIMLLSMVVLSLCAHLFYILAAGRGVYMKGANDGLSQMLPFKQFIYEKYTTGDFFYAADFGLGGDIFSTLAYYFSTNLFFLPWVVGTWIISQIVPLTVDFNYWLALVIPMSVVKQTAIMYIAYLFIRKLTNSPKASYVGAAVYAINPFFFRHEVYWDILTDIMFWIPLLLLGIEKIVRRESGLLFAIAVAAVMISNFYLAYITLFIGGIYAVVRLFYSLSENEQTKRGQLGRYVMFGGIGAGISVFAFLPAAHSFLINVRPPFKDPIKFINMNDDMFTNPRVLWIPVFIFILFFMKALYRSRTYRLFAIMAIVGMIGHCIPYVGSMFNGFSAPQQRWEAIVILSFSVMLAVALNEARAWRVKRVPFFMSIAAFIALSALFKLLTPPYTTSIPLVILTMMWLGFLLLFYKRKWPFKWFAVSVIMFSLLQVNLFNMKLEKSLATKDFIQSEAYNSAEQQTLISWMKGALSHKNHRIDWHTPTRNNTPIIQNFNGTSVYSSILNGDLLRWYWHDLQIDMSRESVSRYGTLGSRANLMALEQVQFYMRQRANDSVPDGFELMKESKHYRVYETKQLLPAFRVMHTTYDQAALNEAPILAKEHAMLNGVITEDGQKSAPFVKEVVPTNIEVKGGTWLSDQLTIQDASGVIVFDVQPSKRAKTLYVSFYVEGIHHQKWFPLQLNEYRTTRKKSKSIYRTNANHLTLAIRATDNVKLTLPEGSYRLKDVKIYEEDGATLAAALKHDAHAAIEWDDGDAVGTVTAQDGDILATSIPYKKGWHATINGEKVDVMKVNYAFVGVPLSKGQHTVELHYLPPYWPYAAWVSIGSALLLIISRIIRRRTAL